MIHYWSIMGVRVTN